MDRRRAELAIQPFPGNAGNGVITAVVLGDLTVAAADRAVGSMAGTASASLSSLGGLDRGGLLG